MASDQSKPTTKAPGSRPAERPTTLPSTGFIRQKELIPTFIPWSHATLWRQVRLGKFPAPRRLSQRTVAWSVEDVKAWIEARWA